MASLRAFECLVAVADSGSITEAARLLFLSQPAVSHQIAVLEREAGTALVRREPRGVRLTSAGRAAVADARRAVEAAKSSMRSAREVGRSPGGILRLACTESLTVALLAPVIGRWHVRFPEVAITLRESASTEELLAGIDADEIDVAVVPEVSRAGLATTLVAEEEIVLALHVGYPLVEQETIGLADLDGRPLVQFGPDNGLSGWLDQSLAKAGVHPMTAMRTSVTATAPQLAAAGLGIAVCPVGAIGAGYPGRVRSFTPRWFRRVVAVTRAEPEPIAPRFIDDLRKRGMPVPRALSAQLGP